MTPVRHSRVMFRSVGHCLFFCLKFLESILHPLGVCRLKFRVSGGTPSAPTGCSPQGYGGLLAVDHGLYILNFSFIRLCRMDFLTDGGTLSAPTGCSPRDCGRLLAVDYSLKNTSHFFGRQVDWSTLTNRTSGGMLSAPTGCSPRDYGRMLGFGCSLGNA